MNNRAKSLLTVFTATVAGVTVAAQISKKKEQKNPEYGKAEINLAVRKTAYEKYIKRGLDIVLSATGIVLLLPVYLVTAIAIFIDDPGPIIFSQKRVGEEKSYFKLFKFRSMLVNTPEKATHELANPESYITRVGRFIRKTSIDELPQLFNCLRGDIHIVSVRPALWSQDDLIAERDKYGANSVKPGITGWAQVNGRDTIDIKEKAMLDGEYVQALRKSSLSGFVMDVRCLIKTVFSVLRSDGVVEGGTGTLYSENTLPLPQIAKISQSIDFTSKKKILVAGKGSYIGDSFITYLSRYENYTVDSFSTTSDEWKSLDFSSYDVVYDVAGIAHTKETSENRHLYYDINRDLAVAIAEKAKAEGVKQFIYLSSMSVYGLTVGKITATTLVNPINSYGKSKLEAERLLWNLNDKSFKISIVRPPMVYGNGCKGNYQFLRKFAIKFGFFPKYENERSMLYIDNLSSAIRGIIHNEQAGLYFPQNIDYVSTYDMIQVIARSNGKNFCSTKLFNLVIKIATKKIMVLKKVFGSLTYEKVLNVPNEWIVVKNNEESIKMSESTNYDKKKALMIGSMASMLDNFNRGNIDLLKSLGYEVTLAANFKDEDSNSQEKDILFFEEMSSKGYDVVQIDFSRNIYNIKKQIKSFRQVKKLLKNNYNLVHCHSPICAAFVRFLFKKYRKDKKHKIIYTAHGFHFYKGAPLKNWLVFYPMEWICSWWTDVLIAINKEDYNRAKKAFHARKTLYVPGVGVDTEKFKDSWVNIEGNRNMLGVEKDAFVLLSVGELNTNKNHSVVISALAKCQNNNIHYYIAGIGELENELNRYAEQLGIASKVHLLGFRNDIPDLLKIADIYILPSIREGLNVSLMEAMASGLPAICLDIRGNRDLIVPGKGGYLVEKNDPNVFSWTIDELLKSSEMRKSMAEYNMKRIRKFDQNEVARRMRQIYTQI